MDKILITCFIVLLFLSACKKQSPLTPAENALEQTDPNGYIKHTIFKGKHYSNKNGIKPVKTNNLSFAVKFDSSAVYTTVKAENQTDINKLFGFSDNNAKHHEFSARFGWRWSNNALRIFAYTYNQGKRSFVELGSVDIGKENNCSILVSGENYLFSLNGYKTTMPRASKTTEAEGYKLYPYFGGDESAPHDINIWIKEVPPQKEAH